MFKIFNHHLNKIVGSYPERLFLNSENKIIPSGLRRAFHPPSYASRSRFVTVSSGLRADIGDNNRRDEALP